MSKKLTIDYTDKDVDTFVIVVDGIELNKKAILNMFEYWLKNNVEKTKSNHNEINNIVELSFNEYLLLLGKNGLSTTLVKSWFEKVRQYITDMEAMEKENIESEKKMRDEFFELLKKHNELTRDVRLYFDLTKDFTFRDNPEFWLLRDDEEKELIALSVKLTKVGDEK